MQINVNVAPQNPIEPEPKMSFRELLSQNKWAIVIICASVLIIAFLAYLIFRQSKNSQPTNPKVSISISAPQQIPSGHEINYLLTVFNNENTTIKGIVVDMIYPQGFSFESSNPSPSKLDGSEFSVPDLPSGQSVPIGIRGTIVGNANEYKTVSAVMHYQFTTFNSTFIAQNQSRTQITNSNIVLSFDGQNSVPNEQTLDYALTYSNNTANDLQNIQLKLTLPDNFGMSSASPQLDSQNSLNIPVLPANTSGKLDIVGKFQNGAIGSKQTFTAEAIGPDSNGQKVSLSINNFDVLINNTPLAVTMNVTDTSSQNQSTANVVNPGDVLQFSLIYQNNGTVVATGVSLLVTLNGAAYDLATIQARNASISGNLVTWDASSVSDFNSLQPNKSGNVQFTVAIKNPAIKNKQTNLSLTAQSLIKSVEYTEGFQSSQASLKIQTVPTINGSIRYSSGANPPQTGQSTTYLVTLSVGNSTNNLNNAQLTLNMPNILGFDTTSISSSEINNVTYNRNTKGLTWNLGTLATHLGDFNALRKLQFNLTITPPQSSQGQVMTLVNNISLTGQDDFTSNTISKTIRDLTTNDNPGGDGTVR